MTKSDLHVWVKSKKPEYSKLSIKEPEELSDLLWRISAGEEIGDLYPNDIPIWDLDIQGGKKVHNFLPNNHGLYIVSPKLRSILETSGAKFEFLPLKIRNQRKKIIKETYWIVNLLDIVYCTDLENSEFRMHALKRENEIDIAKFIRLAIDESKIPDSTKIFRLGERKRIFIIRDELIKTILDEKNCKGSAGRFQELAFYGQEWRDPDVYEINEKVGY